MPRPGNPKQGHEAHETSDRPKHTTSSIRHDPPPPDDPLWSGRPASADAAHPRAALSTIAHTLPPLLDVLLRVQPQLVTLVVLLEEERCRRAQDGASSPMALLRPGLVFDVRGCELRFDEPGGTRAVRLMAQERAVLVLLLATPRRWVSLSDLVDHLASEGLLSVDAASPERSVTTAIYQLRRKLGDRERILIRLRRRVGYAIFPVDSKR